MLGGERSDRTGIDEKLRVIRHYHSANLLFSPGRKCPLIVAVLADSIGWSYWRKLVTA